MTLPHWLTRVWRKKKPSPKGKLCCVDCSRPIHKHDRYKIVQVKHVDCKNPQLAGQLFEDELTEQAGTTRMSVI